MVFILLFQIFKEKKLKHAVALVNLNISNLLRNSS